jgi:hypothetical protein
MRRLLAPLWPATIVAVALTALLVPSVASAGDGTVTDCAQPMPLDKVVNDPSQIVFVGAVTAVEDGGRTASVTVKEVWQGDVPPEVTVAGGQDPTNQAEDDRTFEVAVAYLFVPILAGDHFVDSVCSATVAWSDDLVKLRPPGAHAPDTSAVLSAEPTSPGPLSFLGSFAGPVAVAALVGGGAFGFALLVARRRDA